MIVGHSDDILLTDYDCVTKVGEKYANLGTFMYSPSRGGTGAEPSDVIFARRQLRVLFEREPFRHDGDLTKDSGLNWADIDRDAYPALAAFLDRATDPKREKRYATVAEALADLADRRLNGLRLRIWDRP